MPAIDIIDETFIAAPREALVGAVADERLWRRIGLELRAYQERGLDGVRWTILRPHSGTAEVWLERFADGTIVHAYIRAEPRDGRGADRERRRLQAAWKREVGAIKAVHDATRAPGVAPHAAPSSGERA